MAESGGRIARAYERSARRVRPDSAIACRSRAHAKPLANTAGGARRLTSLDRISRGDVKMKIVVIGGTGLIGSRLVASLRRLGHEAVPAAPDTGVNTITGEGLAEVLAGAQ